MREEYRSPWFNLNGYLACTVKYDDGTKVTVLQHREIVEKSLGRKLLREEVVHHKDGNKRNNRLNNLEVMSLSEHSRTHMYSGGPELVKLQCIRCGVIFDRLARNERNNRKQGKRGPFCGKSCAGKYSTGR